jgi:hypothetical protein
MYVCMCRQDDGLRSDDGGGARAAVCGGRRGSLRGHGHRGARQAQLVHVCVCMYVCMYVCVCMCVCMYICIYVCLYL